MASFVERLALLIDADGKGAIRELQGVGREADRTLSRTEQKLDRLGGQLTSFGTAAVTGATVVGTGLFKAAQAASSYGEQVSRASKTFGEDAVEQLELWSDGLSESAGISKTAGLEAANQFAALGKQAGYTGEDLVDFSTTMVQSAGDLASLADVPVDEAIMAFGSALRGESEPISKFGVDTKEAALQTEALRVGIIDSSRQLTEQEKVLARQSILLREGALWAGDFRDTSDSLGNRMKTLRADFEDAAVALGEGVLPVAESALGAISSLGDAFGDLDPDVQKGVGSFLTYATAAVGTAGALSLVAGQAIKMRGRFTTVTTVGDKTTTSLNRMGRAAAGLSAAFGVLATISIADSIRANLADDSGRLEVAQKELLNSVEGTNEEILRSFSELAGAQPDNFFTEIPQVFGKNLKILPDVAKETIEDIEAAFESLTIPEQRAVLDALEEYGNGLERGSQEAKDNADLIDNLSERYDRNASASKNAAKVADETSDAISGTGDAAKDAAENFDQVDEALKATEDALARFTVNADAAAEASTVFGDTLDNTSVFDNAIANSAALGDNFATFREDIKGLPKDLDESKIALGQYNEEQRKAIGALTGAADANRAYLEGLVEQGSTNEEVQGKAANLREEYRRQFEQLGFNQEQVDAYLQILGLTPEQVDTALTVSRDAEARFKIQAYQGIINSTPPEKLTEFYARVDQGDYVGAANALSELANPGGRPRTAQFAVSVGLSPAATQTLASVRAAFRAEGGPVSADEFYIVGEKGPELFVPAQNGQIIPNDEAFSPSFGLSAGGAKKAMDGSKPAAMVTNVHFHGPVTRDDEQWVLSTLRSAYDKNLTGTRL